MAFKMKAGKEGPMRKNFPGAFKLKDGDEIGKVTKDVKKPVKNSNIEDFRRTMDIPHGKKKTKDTITEKRKQELMGTFISLK